MLACLLPSVEALDAPLWPAGSLPPAGACCPALRCLPGRDSHPLVRCSFQHATCGESKPYNRSRMSWRLRLRLETILRLTVAVLGSTLFSIGLCAADACLDDQAH